jgi:hypothetical protein
MMVGVKRKRNRCSSKQGGKSGKSSQNIVLSMLPLLAPLLIIIQQDEIKIGGQKCFRN